MYLKERGLNYLKSQIPLIAMQQEQLQKNNNTWFNHVDQELFWQTFIKHYDKE